MKDLSNSLRGRLEKDGMTKSGFYMGDRIAPFLYPIIESAFPTPDRMKERENEGE